MANANYQINTIPVFPGEMKTTSLDYRGRAPLPASMRNVISERNKYYLTHINDVGGEFIYLHPSIFLGSELIATIDPKETKKVSERNLAQIVTRESKKINVDTRNLNSEINVIETEIEGKNFLVAYPFFDWVLYGTNLRNEREGKEYNFILNQKYSKLKVDPQGRIPLSAFYEKLDIPKKGDVGFKGFHNVIIIGKPEYMQRK